MYVSEAFVNYLVYNPILNVNFYERATLLYFNIDLCERDTHIRRLASVGLAQARPNNQYTIRNNHFKESASQFRILYLFTFTHRRYMIYVSNRIFCRAVF